MEFFKKQSKNNIMCTACARYCQTEDGQVGYCGVRKNEAGELVLLTFGKIVFLKQKNGNKMHVGTLGSNARMHFDPNWDTSLFPFLRAQEVGREKTNQEIKEIGYNYTPFELVKYLKEKKCKEVVFEYNEPLIYLEYILEVCKIAKKQNIKTSIVTTGYFSQESVPCVDEISLYFFSTFEKFYIKHCSFQLKIVKENIELVFQSKSSLKILCPLIPQENDDEKNIENISKFLFDISPTIPLTFLKFSPAFRMLDKEVTSKEKLLNAVEIAKNVGLKNVDFVF